MLLSHQGYVLTQTEVAQRVLQVRTESDAAPGDRAEAPVRGHDPTNQRVTQAALLEAIPGLWTASNDRRVWMEAVSLVRPGARRPPKLDPGAVLDEFRHGRPVIIGVAGHAMVLFGITFEKLGPNAEAWRLTGGWVADPQIGPGTTSKSESGIRRLRSDELSPSLLLALRIRTDAPD